MNRFSLRLTSVFIAAATISTASCRTPAVQKAAASQDSETTLLRDFPEHSDKTVIVSLKSGTSEDEVKFLAERHNLSVVYIYRNLSMCTLASKKSLNTAELQSLINTLEQEEIVVSAEMDRIIRLDDREWKGFNQPLTE